MKFFTKSALAGALSLTMLMSAAPVFVPQMATTVQAEKAAKHPSKAFYIDFKAGRMPDDFEAAHGWTNGNLLNVNWYNKNITFKGGKMQLIIDHDPTNANDVPAIFRWRVPQQKFLWLWSL